MVKKIKPGKGGSPYQPYEAPKEDPNNPYVPAPKKASKNRSKLLAQSDKTITEADKLHKKNWDLYGKNANGSWKNKAKWLQFLRTHGLPLRKA